jgi:hypothetical protein
MKQYMEMTDNQLRQQLIDEYSQQTRPYPDNPMVRSLKGELYKRGYRRSDIVELALAGLIRRDWRTS